MASEEGCPPPLPSENPPSPPPLPPALSPPPLPPTLSPPPLSPPPSMQMSSPLSDWLDFDPGVGGNLAADLDLEGEGPPLKKARLEDTGSDCGKDPFIGAILDEDSLEEGEICEWNQPDSEELTEADLLLGTKDTSASEDGRDEDLQNETLVEAVDADANTQPTAESSETLQDDDSNSNSLHKQQFEIIDDLGGSDDDMHDYDSDDLDEEEIDALLDEGLQVRKRPKEVHENDPTAPVEREKVILREISKDPFDILPEGWVMLTHDSGMPVYLHRESRVCTYARPYFLGSGSARKHDIPLSAIPCLHYARELKKLDEETNKPQEEQNGKSQEELHKDDSGGGDTEVKKENLEGNGTVLTNGNASDGSSGDALNTNNNSVAVKVASVESYKKENTLDSIEVRKYCEKLFLFEYLTIKKYRSWKDRRAHHKMLRSSRPTLPSNTKLITCPVIVNKQDENMPARKKEFVLNPAGKTEICILHEYVQHSLRVQPKYIFKELENAQTPYSATVVINEVEYGTGYATSKKAAKNEAAKVTLAIMIPQLANQGIISQCQDIHDLSFFDEVKIEDPRVHDLCTKAGQPSPFQILCECLRRNFGMGDTNCQMEMNTLKHQKSEFVMRVGKHTATVVCKNKREGKQLAAQAVLQLLHPHIRSWGSLLRLYGTDWKAIKEKEEEVSVTALHAKAKQHQPNIAILTKLRQEMKKLQMRQNWSAVIGRHGLLDALNLDGDLPEYNILLLQFLVLLSGGGESEIGDGSSGNNMEVTLKKEMKEMKEVSSQTVTSSRPEEELTVNKEMKVLKDVSSQTVTSSRVLVMKEDSSQAGQGLLATMVNANIQAVAETKDVETQIDTMMERTWEAQGEEPMDLFVFGLSHYHVATQTHREGEMQFHKATQYPDVLYTPDQSNTIQVPEYNAEPNRIRILSPKPARPPVVQHQPKHNPAPGMMYMPRPRNIHYIAKGRAYQNSGDEVLEPSAAVMVNQSTSVVRSSQPSANVAVNAVNPRMQKQAFVQTAARPALPEAESYPVYPVHPQQPQYYPAYWPPQQSWPWQ